MAPDVSLLCARPCHSVVLLVAVVAVEKEEEEEEVEEEEEGEKELSRGDRAR